MYASLTTRPDITFAVTNLSKFGIDPGTPHWDAAKRVMHYLAGTIDLELTYGEVVRELKGWVDADGSQEE
jgi:hypothetical protein